MDITAVVAENRPRPAPAPASGTVRGACGVEGLRRRRPGIPAAGSRLRGAGDAVGPGVVVGGAVRGADLRRIIRVPADRHGHGLGAARSPRCW
jgi:hypothetical protein